MDEFNEWNEVKIGTDKSEYRPEYFRSRQVWWCRIGKNIGREINGKNKDFTRPILIIRRITADIFIGIPLTHTLREDDFNTSFYFNENLNCVGFTQIRTFDAKRLTYRIGMVSVYVFSKIIKKLKKIL